MSPTPSRLDIVANGSIDAGAKAILSRYGKIVIAPDGSEASLLPLMEKVVGLVVRRDGVATQAMIDRAPSLRVVGRSGAGYDSVDLAAVASGRFRWFLCAGAGARAVAETAMTLILTLAKNITYWDRQMKSRFRELA